MQPNKPRPPHRPGPSSPAVRITMMPHAGAPAVRSAPAARRVIVHSGRVWWESLPWWLALMSGLLLLAVTVGWPWYASGLAQASAGYHHWQGRQALRDGEAQIVVQRHWQAAIESEPRYAPARLDLARSYIDGQWYGGAIQQAQAVLKLPKRTRAESSLAYTYMGYSRHMLGYPEQGKVELEMAVTLDPENALAQSVLERLATQGKLPKLEP